MILTPEYKIILSPKKVKNRVIEKPLKNSKFEKIKKVLLEHPIMNLYAKFQMNPSIRSNNYSGWEIGSRVVCRDIKIIPSPKKSQNRDIEKQLKNSNKN